MKYLFVKINISQMLLYFFINKGFLPEAIINYISLLGWSPKDNTEKMSMEELIEKFDVSGLSKSGSI